MSSSLMPEKTDAFISTASHPGSVQGTVGSKVRLCAPKSMSEQIAKFTLFQCLSQLLFCFQSPYKGESHRLL